MQPPSSIPQPLWDDLTPESRALVLLLSDRQEALERRVAGLETRLVPGGRRLRPRITLLTLMLVVAASAFLSWAAVERRNRLGPLRADLARLEARAAWSESMYKKQYLSKSQRDADRIALEKARLRAGRLWPPPAD